MVKEMTDSQKFIKFLIELYDDIPVNELNDSAKDCIIDYLACAFAGSKIIGDKVQKLLSIDQETGNTPLIGMKIHVPPAKAALVNTMNVHATELDDGHRFAMLHIEAPVISALIAAVSNKMITEAQAFLKGIIIGYEVTCRLAQVMQPGHKIKGFHATGTCSVCGAALAIGFAAGFSEEELMNTLSAAVASASGLLEMIDSPSQLKPYTVGNAAHSGYIAACIGKAGFVGPLDPLFGKRGFYNAFSDTADRAQLFQKENTYKIQQRYTKPYASCRHCHPPTEAVLKIKEFDGFNVDAIDRINIETYSLAIFGHDMKRIDSISAAKMSIPFSVATALVNGEAGFNSYSMEAICNERIKSLAQTVFITESKEFNEAFPEKRGAKVSIKTKDNKNYEYKVEYPLGEPENPMNREDIIAKYYELGRFAKKGTSYLDNLLDLTLHLEQEFCQWLKSID